MYQVPDSGSVPFSFRWLPAVGNSENIAGMKSLAAIRCLVIATMALVAAALPLAGTAQEILDPAQAPAQAPAAPAPEPIPKQRFVADKLVLNVYAEADQGSARVATIQTGDAVDELERSGTLVRVRLEDGREGWVGANYLADDAPAIVRLRELQRQQPTSAPRIDKAAAEENTRLKKENAALRGQVIELQTRVASLAAVPAAKEQPVETPVADTTMQAAALGSPAPGGGVWGWLLAMILVGAVSFAGGYQALARRLRRKFGALKIY